MSEILPQPSPQSESLPEIQPSVGMRDQIERIWQDVPLDTRRQLMDLVNVFPAGSVGQLRKVFDLASVQARMAFGNKQRVAIVGPANVGKSTLFNQLIQHQRDRAQVSPVPGTTKVNQQADTGLFAVIDTPGVDAVGETGQRERAEALRAAQVADVLVIVFDAVQGIKQSELELFLMLSGLGKPYLVVLNKMDLVGKQDAQVLLAAANALNISTDQIVPIAARSGRNIERVLLGIVKAEPELLAMVAQAMPAYRKQLTQSAIINAASSAALVGLIPLPIIDFIPLTAIQVSLVLALARVYNYKLDLSRARELVMTFGMGYLGRLLFQELSKLGGPPGWALAAAVAGGTTAALGYAAAAWFERGERLSAAELKQLSQTLTNQLLNRLRLRKKQPSKDEMEIEVREQLETNAT
ncbi:MAG TPA: 50S ribosome-binding GTPase [Anaerolineales bacterium]|nr:50S ribosome-binding GTPase [Anaerolineales bacterium]